LTVEPDTAFARQNVETAAEEDAVRQYDTLRETLAGAGYEHYEISNFALHSRRSRHNSAYWTGAAYLGIGPSAHSYDGARLRRWNEQTLEAYIAGPAYQSETLSDDELWDEYLMTRLRTAEGVSETEIAPRFGARRLQEFEKCAAGPLAAGTLVKIDGNYVIPSEKVFVSDGIICSLVAK
ncbi:MAG: coproporphyrinogen III oxidase family protein, partial [Rikenellaceae bacterium]|nr:coproporphyrinogen III oxidase family protein [Rikenellaceae bacterium]